MLVTMQHNDTDHPLPDPDYTAEVRATFVLADSHRKFRSLTIYSDSPQLVLRGRGVSRGTDPPMHETSARSSAAASPPWRRLVGVRRARIGAVATAALVGLLWAQDAGRLAPLMADRLVSGRIGTEPYHDHPASCRPGGTCDARPAASRRCGRRSGTRSCRPRDHRRLTTGEGWKPSRPAATVRWRRPRTPARLCDPRPSMHNAMRPCCSRRPYALGTATSFGRRRGPRRATASRGSATRHERCSAQFRRHSRRAGPSRCR